MYFRILAIAAKDIKILLRDRMAFALLLGMPIMLIVILSFALKSTFEQPPLAFDLPVIDRDASAQSQHLVEILDTAGGITTKSANAEERLREQVRDGKYLVGLI